jgi:hypothetical protein
MSGSVKMIKADLEGSVTLSLTLVGDNLVVFAIVVVS